MPVAPPIIDGWIDLPRFTALHGDARLLERVTPIFRRQAAGWLDAFEETCTAGDDPGVLLLLHKMKGSCAALCALALAADLEAAERSVRQRGLLESTDVIRSIRHAIIRLTDDLATLEAAETCRSGTP
jgi:hypothetical protein